MDHPSRRPAPDLDYLNLPIDTGTIASLTRTIWSPNHGYGLLVGSVGRPPALADVGVFETRLGKVGIPMHAAAFFVLN